MALPEMKAEGVQDHFVTNDLDTLLTALYVFLDDHVIGRGRTRRIGRPPLLGDAELLCLAIAQVLLGFSGERHWVRYARKNLRGLFPYIPEQSGYNCEDHDVPLRAVV